MFLKSLLDLILPIKYMHARREVIERSTLVAEGNDDEEVAIGGAHNDDAVDRKDPSKSNSQVGDVSARSSSCP